MKKRFSSIFLLSLIISACGIVVSPIKAKNYFSTRSYTKKSPYAGLGKISKVNGRIKSKTVSGHAKRTSRGYTYVNPYARSK